ncbi:stage V sporulation protein B [Gottschalkia purinilytica]|uniref:Stage V sporulation protein B n=1 Tax=Gottschalkia purinilytica TaxID=1503 RepID=A0A0L0WDK2_GOTPU|nr:polysaccharide biosynthesis protein [Gottschalkia purinilytica]KNF09495.1 stage V sporulation protein B [Gottschalkia purinilytica]
MTKKGFIYSTTILILVNFVVRFIGFAYKIILSKNIGAEGIGLYHIVSPVLMLAITFTTSGLPIAVSKLVASQQTISNSNGSIKVFKVAFCFSFLLSILLSLILLLFNGYISFNLLKNNDVRLAVILLIPAIIIISLSSILRGYFYGINQVNPPGIAQVIEQVTRVLFVIGIMTYLKGVSPKVGLLIATIAVSVGEFFGFLWLLLSFKISSFKNKKRLNSSIKYSSIFSKLVKISFPITISRLTNVLMQLINAILIPQLLIKAGYTNSEAIGMFGRLMGMAMPLIFLPFIVTSALVVNIVPTLSKLLDSKEEVALNSNIHLCIKITLLVSIPITGYFIFFATPISKLFYNDVKVSSYIVSMSYSIVFLSLQHTLSGILQGIGKQLISTINHIIGTIIQLITSYYLISNPSFGINGFFISFILSTLITFVLNYITLEKSVKIKFKFIDYILKPTFATMLSLLITFITYIFIINIGIKSFFVLLICMSVSGSSYLLLLFVTKALPDFVYKKFL